MARTKLARTGGSPCPTEGAIGCAVLYHPIHTDSLAVANREKHRHEELVKSRGPATADAYVEIATGRTRLSPPPVIEEWIAERQMKPRQVLDYRRAVKKLLAHLPTATVEAVDKRAAGDYRAALTRLGVHLRTATKDISALASLWKHLESRGLASSNPWALGGYTKTPATGRGSARKRPLTGDEVARLLTSSHASPMLKERRDQRLLRASA